MNNNTCYHCDLEISMSDTVLDHEYNDCCEECEERVTSELEDELFTM